MTCCKARPLLPLNIASPRCSTSPPGYPMMLISFPSLALEPCQTVGAKLASSCMSPRRLDRMEPCWLRLVAGVSVSITDIAQALRRRPGGCGARRSVPRHPGGGGGSRSRGAGWRHRWEQRRQPARRHRTNRPARGAVRSRRPGLRDRCVLCCVSAEQIKLDVACSPCVCHRPAWCLGSGDHVFICDIMNVPAQCPLHLHDFGGTRPPVALVMSGCRSMKTSTSMRRRCCSGTLSFAATASLHPVRVL